MKTGHGNLNGGAVLFFVDLGYADTESLSAADRSTIAEEAYRPGQEDTDFVHGLQLESWIDASALVCDDTARKEVEELLEQNGVEDGCAEVYGEHFKGITAQAALDGSVEQFLDTDGELSWEIQRIRAEVARRMGYDAVRDRDENGEVYIVDFSGGNLELELLGRVSEMEEAQEPS